MATTLARATPLLSPSGIDAESGSGRQVAERTRARSEAMPSFEAIYDEYVSFVWRSARRLGVADASVDDVVQDVFVVVHRRLPDYEARSSFKSWLFGIVLGIVRNHRRSVRRRFAVFPPRAEGIVDGPGELGPDATLARAQGMRLLYQLLDSLDDDKREVFVLAELEQLTGSEIAQVLGVGANTVYSRLRAAWRDFEHALARENAREGWRVP
jgi:RNA polymerase sigma-70 factor (ECF subfamily)